MKQVLSHFVPAVYRIFFRLGCRWPANLLATWGKCRKTLLSAWQS